ncbi:MAG: ribose-5-phosphate isomerase RpiA [Methanomicrobiales archaeon]
MDQKRIAAYEAAQMIEDGNVVGLGTGSTTHHFIKKLGERINNEEIEIMGIPTSYQSFFIARDANIPLTTLEEHDIDIAVDGADEVDPDLNLIKGGGAAHTMEKIVDGAADKFVVIVDESKIVEKLGNFPVPVEVIPLALKVVKNKLNAFDGLPSLRMAVKKDGPVITDNGNFILDAKFDKIEDPSTLEKEINNIPGVVENGIFSGMAHEVIIGTSEGLKRLK